MASIGKVAWLLGVSEKTLREWERNGAIPNAPRTSTNRREYPETLINELMRYVDYKRAVSTERGNEN